MFGLASRPGVFLDLQDLDGTGRKLVNTYRSPDEVFSDRYLRSYAGKPLTLGHPPGGKGVTRANLRQLVVGHVRDAFRHGEFVGVRLVITDRRAVTAIGSGRARQLSVGQVCDELGCRSAAPDGTPIVSTQVNLRVNHVALVAEGNAGPDCRVIGVMI
jgi:hypothetical protein